MNACLAYRFQNRIPREKNGLQMRIILETENLWQPLLCGSGGAKHSVKAKYFQKHHETRNHPTMAQNVAKIEIQPQKSARDLCVFCANLFGISSSPSNSPRKIRIRNVYHS